MKNLKIIISGGGTGGHIFPAIAIADEIKNRYPDADILFVGANNRMEMDKVPAAGYPIVGLDVTGFYRKQIWKNFSVLWKFHRSRKRAKETIRNFKPNIVIGVGGYASAPTLKQANASGIPTLIQEQNSYAGITNKLLAKGATTICVAYEGMERFFPAKKIVLTGNPYRKSLINNNITREEAAKAFKLSPDKKTVLVIGGSLGSFTINNAMIKSLETFIAKDIQVIWQCGKSYLFDLNVEMQHKTKIENVCMLDFIGRMDLAYKLADIVISRAGAGAITELALTGKPSILIPSPNVAEDHQTQNALALVKKNAAIMIPDNEAVKKMAQVALETLASDEKLKSLSTNISKFAQKDATDKIVDEVVKIIKKRKSGKK